MINSVVPSLSVGYNHNDIHFLLYQMAFRNSVALISQYVKEVKFCFEYPFMVFY